MKEPAPDRERLEPEDIMTVREVADFLRVSTQTVHNYAKRGVLPSRKMGGRLVFLRPELEERLWGSSGG